jgi:urease accessory protein
MTEIEHTPSLTLPQGGGGDSVARSAGDVLYKLTSWLSPAYPVGAFTYSHGLEAAIAAGDVLDAVSAQAWIADCLEHGAGRSDAILLACVHRAAGAGDTDAVGELSELAEALAPSAERLLETTAQGRAFAEVTEASWGGDSVETPPYAVAIGVASVRHGIPVAMTVEMFLHAFASNLISACVRLVPLGQTEGQKILSALMPVVRGVAKEAEEADIDDIGGCAFGSDIASMRHETQEVRLFRS